MVFVLYNCTPIHSGHIWLESHTLMMSCSCNQYKINFFMFSLLFFITSVGSKTILLDIRTKTLTCYKGSFALNIFFLFFHSKLWSFFCGDL